MASKYISLQGRFYLAEITNGVAGALRALGNVPEFELEIGADIAKFLIIYHNRSYGILNRF